MIRFIPFSLPLIALGLKLVEEFPPSVIELTEEEAVNYAE